MAAITSLADLSGHGSGLYGSTQPVAEAPPAPPRPKTPIRGRTNKYAAKCVNCGIEVPAGEGSLSKGDSGWIVTHPGGQCPMVDASTPSLKGADDYQNPVWPGIYTIETDEGHRTFRVKVQASDADFAPGQTVLEYLSGSDNEHDYTSFAFIRDNGRLAPWKRYRSNDRLIEDAEDFLADPDAALDSKLCLRCSATLTTPESIEAGMGPTCIKKGW